MKALCIVSLFLFTLTLWSQQTVKIGVNIGLTGRGEDMDTREIQKALLLGQDQLNKRPVAPYRYQLIFEDNNYTPAGAVLAARKLLSLDKVDAFITIYDFAVAPTAPIMRAHKVPSVGFAWGVDKADSQYNFIFGCSELAQAQALYKGIKKSPQVPTTIVGVLQSSIPGFVSHMQSLAKADGNLPFGVMLFNPGELEFRSMILKLKASGAQRIVLVAWGGELNKFLYQLKQCSDYKPELWGLFFFRYAQERSSLAGSVITGSAPMSAEFDKMFRVYAHHAPVDNTVFAYDALQLIAQGLEETPISNQPLSERIAQGLRAKTTFNGYSGSYTQNKGVFDVPTMLYRLTATGEVPFESQ